MFVVNYKISESLHSRKLAPHRLIAQYTKPSLCFKLLYCVMHCVPPALIPLVAINIDTSVIAKIFFNLVPLITEYVGICHILAIVILQKQMLVCLVVYIKATA